MVEEAADARGIVDGRMGEEAEVPRAEGESGRKKHGEGPGCPSRSRIMPGRSAVRTGGRRHPIEHGNRSTTTDHHRHRLSPPKTLSWPATTPRVGQHCDHSIAIDAPNRQRPPGCVTNSQGLKAQGALSTAMYVHRTIDHPQPWLQSGPGPTLRVSNRPGQIPARTY